MNELTSLSHEELLCFIRSAPASIFFKDTQCRYRFVSDLCGLVHGSAAEDLLGRTDLEVQSDPALGREYYEEDLHILASGQGSHRVSRVPLPSGPVYLEIKKNPVRLHGAVIGIIGVINDITQQVTQERELKELSFRDKLTGLYNRNYLETRMRCYVRADDFPASLIMADCNYLKRVNDTLGHEYGDLMLQRVARCIQDSIPPKLRGHAGGRGRVSHPLPQVPRRPGPGRHRPHPPAFKAAQRRHPPLGCGLWQLHCTGRQPDL